jgi:hypothetical protein
VTAAFPRSLPEFVRMFPDEYSGDHKHPVAAGEFALV